MSIHTGAQPSESLRQLNFIMKHSPPCPDLAFSNCHLFGPLKDSLRGCHFTCDHEVKEAVHVWLVTQPKTFFSLGV
jgi:hypothetical protein